MADVSAFTWKNDGKLYAPSVFVGNDEYYTIDLNDYVNDQTLNLPGNWNVTGATWTLDTGLTSSDEYTDGNILRAKIKTSSAGKFSVKCLATYENDEDPVATQVVSTIFYIVVTE